MDTSYLQLYSCTCTASYLFGWQPLSGSIKALAINHIVSCPLRWHHIYMYLYNHKSFLLSLESGNNTFSISHYMRLVLTNMSCLVESSGRTAGLAPFPPSAIFSGGVQSASALVRMSNVTSPDVLIMSDDTQAIYLYK